MFRHSTRVTLKVLIALVVSLAATTAAFAASSGSEAAPTLVVDKSFEIKTADPQRAFGVLGEHGGEQAEFGAGKAKFEARQTRYEHRFHVVETVGQREEHDEDKHSSLNLEKLQATEDVAPVLSEPAPLPCA